MKTEIYEQKDGETVISIAGIIGIVWQSKARIIKVTIVFALLGLFVALFSQKEFTTSVTFVPQTSSEGIGKGLGGLAAIAGINVGGLSSSTEIPYTTYPQIVESTSFQKKMLHTKLTFSGYDEPLSYYEYYKDYHKESLVSKVSSYTVGLPFTIMRLVRPVPEGEPEVTVEADSLVEKISMDEFMLIKDLRESLGISVNEFDGYVQISANMPDPRAAADLVVKAQLELQETIIELRSGKAKEKLGFIKERFNEKKAEYQSLQEALAKVQDQNLLLSTEASKLNLNRLESEHDVAYQIYSELATQLETQKIQVKENTPMFMTLEPVIVPVEKAKPRRAVILILWTFLGGVFGILLVLFEPIRSMISTLMPLKKGS